MDYTKTLDYSSLSCYIDCPRKFLFQYMLHLRSRKPSIHLVFGSCFHYGLEMSYRRIMEFQECNSQIVLTPTDLTKTSIDAFNALWDLEGAPHFDPDLVFPKSPGHAANMYKKYWELYLSIDLDMGKILAVEHPFSLDFSQFGDHLPAYIGRMDLVFESPDGALTIVDHKTAKSVNAMTFTSFESSLQTDGYLTIGNIYYDKIPTMLYSVALCQKSKIEFHRFPIIKPKIIIERFLSDIVDKAMMIRQELDWFNKERQTLTHRNDIARCFPRSPGYACTAYFNTCPYYDLCKQRANPLLWLDRPPAGYTQYEWNPQTHEDDLAKRLKEAANAKLT